VEQLESHQIITLNRTDRFAPVHQAKHQTHQALLPLVVMFIQTKSNCRLLQTTLLSSQEYRHPQGQLLEERLSL
jgi:hypothetical protein